MSDCCSTSGLEGHPARKHRCPVNGREYAAASVLAIMHHVKKSWDWKPTTEHYYFCDDPECDVVYFGDDDSTIPRSQLRTRVGLKENAHDDLLCYCFGISKADFSRDPAVRDFVIEQTRAGRCSCETSNPSGRCCLKDLPRPDL